MKSIQYIPPKSINELYDFQKLKCIIKDEIWKPILLEGWDGFHISSHGRLFNTKTDKFKKCLVTCKNNCPPTINTLFYSQTIYHNRIFHKTIVNSICDLMLHTFYPDIADTHINPILKDGNIFNLHLNNIKFVPNAYYKDKGYKNIQFNLYGESTQYYINTNGSIVIFPHGYKLGGPNEKLTDMITIYNRSKERLVRSRKRLLAQAFIPNPDKLKYVHIIDRSDLKPSLHNICWSNKRK